MNRDLKKLLELLLADFTDNYKGRGFCLQASLMYHVQKLVSEKETMLISGWLHSLQITGYLFGECPNMWEDTDALFEQNKPKRIEWLKNKINELN